MGTDGRERDVRPSRAPAAGRSGRPARAGGRHDLRGHVGLSLGLSYILPIRRRGGAPPSELTEYLQWLSTSAEVLVVDNSDDDVFAENNRAWSGFVEHLRPDPDLHYRYGKVNNVVTGLRHAAQEAVVIADDDVRWDEAGLQRALARLDGVDVVIPQNYFDPLPWHALWDTGRTLINRATGIDYPGTLVVRRSRLIQTDGYDGEGIFENLELIRTVIAVGGTVRSAPDLFVRRLPPDADHFWSQRVRQAYDEFALPPRMTVWLTVVPLVVLVRRWRLLLVPMVVAEIGRRRNNGRRVFPWTASLLAPAWVLERGVCMWLALGARLRGGAKYAGTRFPLAAHSVKVLRATRVPPCTDGLAPGPSQSRPAEGAGR